MCPNPLQRPFLRISWSNLVQSHPYVCFWSIKHIDPSRLRRRAQPNLIIIYAIIAGLASFFFASSLFLLVLLAFPARWLVCNHSSPVGAHLWHKTCPPFRLGGGKTRLSHCYKMSNPCVNYGIRKKYWLVVSTPLKNINQSGLLFPYGKIKFMVQTTNQKKNWPIQLPGMERRINPVQSPEKFQGPLYTVFRFAGWLVSFRSHRVCPTTRTPRSIRLGH